MSPKKIVVTELWFCRTGHDGADFIWDESSEMAVFVSGKEHWAMDIWA
jgi:hypothetical protein